MKRKSVTRRAMRTQHYQAQSQGCGGTFLGAKSPKWGGGEGTESSKLQRRTPSMSLEQSELLASRELPLCSCLQEGTKRGTGQAKTREGKGFPLSYLCVVSLVLSLLWL